LTGSRSGSTSRSSSNAALPRAKKRFAQHFLSDRNILDRIVDAAELNAASTVVEIGPGHGALTEVLAKRAGRVVCVEVDRELIAGLRERFLDANVRVVEGDALGLDTGGILAAGDALSPYSVVANLPYNIAAPVLRMFLEGDPAPARMVVMVQKEVAESICASPPKMTLLGVATQVYGDARMVMTVPPGAFNPPPKVVSAVVRVDVASAPKVDVPLDEFFRVVRAGFGNPRKMLRNSLSYGLHVKQEVIDEVMVSADVAATHRPQVLSLADWASITQAWIERDQ
jgi:16S rRNA (adenine1518-N6/adenine1519-N6)-dimethyltransferase